MEERASRKRPPEWGHQRTRVWSKPSALPPGQRVRAAVDKLGNRNEAGGGAIPNEIEMGMESGRALEMLGEMVVEFNETANRWEAKPTEEVLSADKECLLASSVWKRRAGQEVDFRQLTGEARKKHEEATVKEWSTIMNSKAAKVLSMAEVK